MNDDRVCQEVLTRAVEAVGGIQALAKLLRRNLQDVEAWLHGTRMAPMKVYFVACLLLSHRRSRFGHGNTPDEFGKRRRSTWLMTEEQAAHYKDAVKIESSLEIRKSLGSTSELNRSRSKCSNGHEERPMLRHKK